jgi:hypothetical protein|tara:strand:- start:14807 stop:15037 length:231 start_codon:yes stop_codon:yes gene_type:complete
MAMLVFEQYKVPDYAFAKAKKKPIAIRCLQIHEPFVVETMEGRMKGKKGDWLMVGVDDEMYACDQEIFKKTYQLID